MKTYTVTWFTKENKREYTHQKTFEAENAKAARKAFDDYYAGLIGHSVLSNYPHPFRIKVKLERSYPDIVPGEGYAQTKEEV